MKYREYVALLRPMSRVIACSNLIWLFWAVSGYRHAPRRTQPLPMLHAVATVGPQLLLTLSMHQRIALTRVSRNMRAAGYRDEEITLVLRALYLSKTRQDMREAWWVVNRRHLPQVSRAELQSTLIDIFGLETRPQLVALLNKQPHRPQMSLSRESGLQLDSTSSEQHLAFMEFSSVMAGLAAAPPSEGVLHFVAGEIVAQRA